MTQDLTQQWLTEINTLKQKVTELQQERDTAWASSEKWRKLYNTEAAQRRSDTNMFQMTISSLKTEIHKLRGIESGTLNDSTSTTDIQLQVEQLQTIEELKIKLFEAMKERDRLQQALKNEQSDHAQTRKSLTTALGDAIDSLTRERTIKLQEQSQPEQEIEEF